MADDLDPEKQNKKLSKKEIKDADNALDKSNKKIKEKIDLLQTEQKMMQDIIASVQTLETSYGPQTAHMEQTVKVQKELLDSLESEATAVVKLQQLNTSINDLLLIKVKAGKNISEQDAKKLDNLIEELSLQEEVIKKRQELAELTITEEQITSQIKGLKTDIKDSLLGAVGVSKNLVNVLKAMSLPLLAFTILAKAVTWFIDMGKEAIELNREFGFSVAHTAKFKANIYAARMQTNLLTTSMEDLEKAARVVVEVTGQIASPELIAFVAELNKKIKDPEVSQSLVRNLETLGITENQFKELTETAKEYAKEQGIHFDADNAAYEILAQNREKMLSFDNLEQKAREEKLKGLMVEGLWIKDQGFDLKELNRIKRGGLDIEKSMRDEMKLRLITGKDISLNALRNAKLFGTEADIAKAQLDIKNKIGTAQLSNIAQSERMFEGVANAMDMSNDALINLEVRQREISMGLDEVRKEKTEQIRISKLATEEDVAEMIKISGGMKLAGGGILQGNSHANGGIQTAFGELEGGEAIINKKSTKLFRPILSALNTSGGGKSFADGGMTHDVAPITPRLLGGGMSLDGLINEIKGLRKDIQTQPIMITVDGRVVSAISKVQKQQNSVRTTGYGR
jgi:hypothetical protein